jgi:hypothetical protein
MALLSFAGASLLAFIAGSVLSVLMLEQQQGLFLLLCALAVVATVLLMVGFGIAGAVLRRFPPPAGAALLGAACAVLFMGILSVAAATSADPQNSWPLLLALPVLGGLAPLLQRKA